MSTSRPEQDTPTNAQNIADWSAMDPEQIAAMDPDGDFTKRHLLNPTVLQMLGNVSGRTVLDAGAGQGYLSRMLARLGAVVTSMEPADALVRHSLRMEADAPLGIEHVKADLTKTSIPPVFDIVVCNMVLVSIQEWEVALAACSGALRPGGTLVVSLQHPCFETADPAAVDTDPCLVLRDYLTERPMPRPVATDFHRTLSTYINRIVEEGLCITGLAEPRLSDEGASEPDAPRQARLLQLVPNFLVIRAERPA